MRHPFLISALFGLALAGCAPVSAPAQAAPVAARPADEFVDALGVNIKVGYDDTGYGDLAKTKSAILELGVRRVRDGLSHQPKKLDAAKNGGYDDTDAFFRDLARSGAKLTAIVGTEVVGDESKSPAQWINATLERTKDFVGELEGPNEPDMHFDYRGQKWPEGAIVFQKELHNAVKNGPFRELKLAGFSLADDKKFERVRGLAHADVANVHVYHGALMPENNRAELSLSQQLAGARLATPDGPFWITETGYVTTKTPRTRWIPDEWSPNRYKDEGDLWNPRISDLAQGKYTARTYFHHFNAGAGRIIVHQLLDTVSSWNDFLKADTDQANFGLFDQNWKIKPAGRVTKNIISILGDKGAPFRAKTLDFTLGGDTKNLQSSLFQKRDGRFFLALWQAIPAAQTFEHPIRDSLSPDLVNPDAQVSISFAAAPQKLQLFLPLRDANASPVKLEGARATIAVPDHPVLLEITPVGVIAAPKIEIQLAQNQGPNLINDGTFEVNLGAWQDYGTRSKAENGAVQIGPTGGINRVIEGLKPNTRYVFRGRARVAGGEEARFTVEKFGGQTLNAPVLGPEFKTYEIPFTTGADATSASLFFWKDTGDALAFGDDFSLSAG